jgi:hypothetical protein
MTIPNSALRGHQRTIVDTFARYRGESCSLQRVTLSQILSLHNVRNLAPIDADSSRRFRQVSSPISFIVTINTQWAPWFRRFHDLLITRPQGELSVWSKSTGWASWRCAPAAHQLRSMVSSRFSEWLWRNLPLRLSSGHSSSASARSNLARAPHAYQSVLRRPS